MNLYLLCGLAFAGKSTLAKAVARRTGAVVVSLDEINEARGLEGGLGIPAEEWERSHREALGRAGEALRAGRSVIVDDTNCFRFLRDHYREIARRHGAPVTVLYLDVPLSLALERLRANDARPSRARVTEEILYELAAQFEVPSEDEEVLVVPAGAEVEEWVARNLPERTQRTQRT